MADDDVPHPQAPPRGVIAKGYHWMRAAGAKIWPVAKAVAVNVAKIGAAVMAYKQVKFAFQVRREGRSAELKQYLEKEMREAARSVARPLTQRQWEKSRAVHDMGTEPIQGPIVTRHLPPPSGRAEPSERSLSPMRAAATSRPEAELNPRKRVRGR